jgi:hypothetical protein
MGVRLEDLPLRLQAQVRAQLAGKDNSESRIQKPESRIQHPEFRRQETPESGTSGARRRGPNKTEGRYCREMLEWREDVVAVHYEGLTFRMTNGHRYTPDWVVVTKAGGIECHEIKGGYAMHSQQRARLAFDQVRVEYPWVVWRWAVFRDGRWVVNSELSGSG